MMKSYERPMILIDMFEMVFKVNNSNNNNYIDSIAHQCLHMII